MRSLRSIRPGTITVERPSAAADSLLFAPILLAVTALPWLAAPTTSYGPLVTTLLGSGWLVYAAVKGLRPTRLEIAVPRGAILVLAQSQDGLDASYRVLLEAGPNSELLLDHDDPARALDELRRIRRELGLEVRPGWGLTLDAILHPEELGPAKLVPADVRSPRWQAQARTTLASCAGALFILAVTAYTFAKVGVQSSLLGRFLPALFAVLVGLAGLLLLTLRLRVRVSERGLRVDSSMFYLSFKSYEVRAADIVRADAVSANGQGAQHVLLQTATGLRSIPLVGPAAAAISRAITATPREVNDSEASWPKPVRGHAAALEENPC